MKKCSLKPSWPSRPKTNVTLLFYFLKFYNFGLGEIFGSRINQFSAIEPMDLKNNKGTKKKIVFGLNLEVLLINGSF